MRKHAMSRDAILLFSFAWLATLLPLVPHRVPTLWIWGALAGLCLVATSWLSAFSSRHPCGIWSLLGCTAVIGVASFCDFSRLPPAYLLSQCRSAAADTGFLAGVMSHIAMHWQWFPVTNAAMLLWICLGFDASAGPGPGASRHRSISTLILPRLGSCLLMIFAMGTAMSAMDVLGAGLHQSLSADAFIAAMVCGMAFYHFVLNLLQSSVPSIPAHT